MNTMIVLEFFKMKRRRFILPIALFSVFGIFWCLAIVMKEWQFAAINRTMFVLINDLIIVNSMILPLLIGTLCSMLVDIEYSGKTFRLLQMSNQSIMQLFFSKAITASIIIFLVGLVQSIFIIVISSIHHVDINKRLLIAYLISFFLASAVLIFLQLSVSLFFQKQSIGMVIALIGSFVGLVTGGMLPWFVQLFFPWQYIDLLNPVKRVIVNAQYHYSFNSNFTIFVLITIVILAVEVVIIRKKLEGVEII